MNQPKHVVITDEFDHYQDQLVGVSYKEIADRVMEKHFLTSDVRIMVDYDALVNILDGRFDVMITMASDTNRTLSYLVPAIIRSPKVTLVFCPSIRRIEGRVNRLKELNILAIMIHSQMSIEDQIEAVDKFLLDSQKAILIYMTPDQVFFEHFKKLYAFLEQTKSLAYLVLDESHNEHQWRSSDKKEYLELGKIRTGALQWVVLSASDQYDIMLRLKKILALQTFKCPSISPRQLDSNSIPDIGRTFTFYDVITYNDDEVSNEDLKQFIQDALDDNSIINLSRSRGLIFCRTGKMADKIATDLQKIGVEINSFHPGLKNDVCQRAYKDFCLGDLQLLAVTSSVGQKLKCSRIRLIIHWGLPSNIKIYQEQTALAKGCRGTLARCRIYVTNEALSYYNDERESDLKASLDNDLGVQRNSNAKLRLELYMLTSEVKDYCLYEKCRHQFLLNCTHIQTLCCEHFCDVCKSNSGEFENERIKIRKEMNSEGVSNYIKKFGNKLKQQIFLEKHMDNVLSTTIIFDELFKATETRSLTSTDAKKARDRVLLRNLFEDIFPNHARKYHKWFIHGS